LFENTNATPQSNPTTINSGIKIRPRDMPDDFAATSSYLSPRFPKVISEANKTVKDNANGTKVSEEYHNSLRITLNSKPLPARSSIYFHKNCIINTNIDNVNVMSSGGKKDFMTNLSSFFIVVLLFFVQLL
jgi:hypothetical protein